MPVLARGSPRSVLAEIACVTRTATKSPTLKSTSPLRPIAWATGRRGTITFLPVSVRPTHSASDFLLVRSTRTRWVLPTSASLRRRASGVKVSITSRKRRCLTGSGTSSTKARWACVFSRRE
eukprot:scaffold96468_cov30-Tisochrysis_lutea.AAC.2